MYTSVHDGRCPALPRAFLLEPIKLKASRAARRICAYAATKHGALLVVRSLSGRRVRARIKAPLNREIGKTYKLNATFIRFLWDFETQESLQTVV
jgi:hypothetical protein